MSTDSPRAPGGPIFVVGHPRSGTTLLRLILDSHSRIVIPPEGHLVSLLRRAPAKFGPLDDERNFTALLDRVLAKQRMQEWGLDLQLARARCLAGERSAAGLFRSLMSLWTERTGKPRWGEKTPGTYRFLADVDRWFPDCQVLHIIRDGRDVAVSCLTPPFSDRYDKGNVYEVAARWRDAVRRGRRASRALGPERYRELKYEELVAEPERVTRQLCEFLREDFEPQMLRFHESAEARVTRGDRSFHGRVRDAVGSQQVERWRRDADLDFVLGFEGLAGRELAECGYRLCGERPSPGLAARILLERLRPRRPVKTYREQGESRARGGAAPGTEPP